ncbi:hypothetical protein [Clostridium sp. UBA5712]|uniref:hypothetical protein n=1 Tax=Clostridium sp. UBA5712 TaxID=1946368 RepID=UPI003218103E
MNILMISFLAKEKEGRFNRCYNSVSKKHEVFIIDVDDREYFDNKRICLKLKNRNPIFRYFEFTYKVIKASKKLKFDTIYAHNYFTCLPAIIISKLGRKKLIYDAYELYYPAGKNPFSMRDSFFYFFEKKAIKSADEVVCANNERALIMAGHYNLRKIPTVIGNMAKDDLYEDVPKKQICNSHIVKIVYAGYLAYDRSILELVCSIKENKYEKKIILDIYGYGPLLNELTIMAAKEEYSFMKIMGSYLNSQLDLILSNYHIGYVSYPNTDFNNIFCCPNKVFDYAHNGLVVLAPNNYGLSAMISKYKIGCCNNNINYAISNILLNYNYYQKNLKLFLNDNNWSNEEVKLLELLNNNSRIDGEV